MNSKSESNTQNFLKMTSITLLAIVMGFGSITSAAFAVDNDGDGFDTEVDFGFGLDVDDTNPCIPDDTVAACDTDNDGVPDGLDLCQGFDDAADQDGDGTPDGCDDSLNVNGDVKPDSDPNSLNCNNKGISKSNVPVGIFSGLGLDASTIDFDSITLNGAPQTEKHSKIHLEDLNGDLIDDAVVHLITEFVCKADGIATAAKGDLVDVTISGTSTSGPWTFEDTILVVKPYAGGEDSVSPDKAAKEIAKAEAKITKIDGKDTSQDKKCEKVLKLENKLAKKGYHSPNVHAYLDAKCPTH